MRCGRHWQEHSEMESVGLEFWLLRAGLVVALGALFVAIDRLLQRVHNWLRWLAIFCILFVLSFLMAAYGVSLLEASNHENGTEPFLIGGTGMLAGFIGIAISFVRWVDTWDHGLLHKKHKQKEAPSTEEASTHDVEAGSEGQTNLEPSLEEAKRTLLNAINKANEIAIVDRLYFVTRSLTKVLALVGENDDWDDPEDEDYPMSHADLRAGWNGHEWSLEAGIGDRAFELTFCGDRPAPKPEQCRRVMVRRGQQVVAEINYEPASEDPSSRIKWRATDVVSMYGTAWLNELEQLATLYLERSQLFEEYRLRKQREDAESLLLERAKKIRLDD
jgi:hypothetical protein